MTAAATATSRPVAPRRRNIATRTLLQGVILVIVAWLATQAYYFAQIGWWTHVNPGTTAYMRAASWRLAHAGSPSDIAHVWVPYAQVSRNLKRAIIASEDATFVNNPGFDTDAMLQAWERNRQRGRMERGGSGITQQLARNLFLSPEKNYFRKGQELIIASMLEFWMDKERILEIYLNSVEWGSGVFGAQAAAQHYFHTSAAQLSAPQAARLAVMLPNPRYFDAHPGSPYLRQRSGVILRRMGSAELPP
ncbi:MAG: monofunctional biosynthetic peptidoglycan transglycosylase [Janthinobacterium lividum]